MSPHAPPPLSALTLMFGMVSEAAFQQGVAVALNRMAAGWGGVPVGGWGVPANANPPPAVGGWGTPNPNPPPAVGGGGWGTANANGHVGTGWGTAATAVAPGNGGWAAMIGGGWGMEHCDDEPTEIIRGGGWATWSLDDPWIPGGRLCQGPLQRGEDDSFRGYQR